jgi:hypothetical protein
MRTNKKFVVAATLSLLTAGLGGCGSESDSSTLATLGTHGDGAVSATVSYRMERQKPRIVNGRPVREREYWACVDTVTLAFSEPVVLNSVVGATIVKSAAPYSSRGALLLKDVSSDFRRVTLQPGGDALCNDWKGRNTLEIPRSVRSVSGKQLASAFSARLAWPASVDSLPARLPEARDGGFVTGGAPSTAWSAAPAAPACVPGTDHCLSVSGAALNQALLGMREWTRRERGLPLYQGSGLKQLPLEYLIQPFAPANRRRQYGNAETLYVLRRAAAFTQLLFPRLGQIPVADLSQADGLTPQVDGILLHPEGSHVQGRDVDVSYITTGSGNDPKAHAAKQWDYEKNFWFLYGVLQSTSVDLVISAYRNEMKAMAQLAHQKGLINGMAVGRFNRIQLDLGMNHDRHAHIMVANSWNAYTSRKFQAADDAYVCYLGLSPTGTGSAADNACIEP